MQSESLKISVVTVCYNAVSTIEETILSVLNQTYDNIEYIIIDGGSTDGTVDIIKKYADRLAYWVSESDKGIYDAMNKGIDAATGDYINFMNAGDTFFNNNTLSQIEKEINPVYEIVYGDTIFKAPACEYRRKTLPLECILQGMPFGHQSTFIKLSLMKAVKYDSSFKSSGDYHFFYNCYLKKKSFHHVLIDVAKYENSNGISIDNYRLVLKENARIKGIEGKVSWRIKYFSTVLYKDLKRLFKILLPKKILLKRQQRVIKSRYST